MNDLIETYLSGAIGESEWEYLLKETPGLQDAWESHFIPKTMNDMKLVIRTQIISLEDDVKRLSKNIELLKRVLNGY